MICLYELRNFSYNNNRLLVKFLPECPPSITNSFCRYPVNGFNSSTIDTNNPNESPVKVWDGEDIPNYRYDINVYNVAAGKRILNTIYLSFHASGLDTQQTSQAADALKTTPLMAVAPAKYSADTFAFGELPVGHIRSNPQTFDYPRSDIDVDAAEMDQVLQRFNRMQASYSEPSIGEHKQGRVNGGRDHRFKSNIGSFPGIAAGAGREEGRHSSYNTNVTNDGTAYYGNFDYGDIGWNNRRGNVYSNLHYDHDGSLCRIFLSTGDYNHFEWCRAGVRFKSDIGFNHVTVPGRNHNNSFTLFTNVYETSYGHIFGRMPDGTIGHRWNEGMKFYYLMTGDRFAKQSLWRNSSALLAHKETFIFDSNEGRLQSRTIKNLINAYQVFGEQSMFDKTKWLMQLAEAKQDANGKVTSTTNLLMDLYFVKAFGSFLFESLAQDDNEGTILSTGLMTEFSRYYKDTFLTNGTGSPSNYIPYSTKHFPSAAADAEGIDIMYIGYLLSQNKDYLKLARKWIRDSLLFNCGLNPPNAKNLQDVNYLTGENACHLGAYPDGFSASVSKNSGWLMSMASFSTLFEALLGGEAVDAKPQIGTITGLPINGNQGLVTVQVTDPDNDIKEVRLEWLSKNDTTADERLQHLICHDDGGSQATEVMVGPVYNVRTQRLSGDQTALDGIYTCTNQAADGLTNDAFIDIRIVAVDQNAQRDFKRFSFGAGGTTPPIDPPPGTGSVILNDDFETSLANWTGWTLGTGSGTQTMKSIGESEASWNTTPIPTDFVLEFDMGKPETSNSVGFYVGMGFNKQSTGGWHVRDHGGYHLQYGIGDYGSNPPTLVLYRDEMGSTGVAEIPIGNAFVNLDTNAHHVKIIDDGTGNIQVFFDGALVIDVNDSANYNTVVPNNTGFLGAMSFGGQHGWIDNVVVTTGGESPPPTTGTVILNDDFETSLANWTGWTLGTGSGTQTMKSIGESEASWNTTPIPTDFVLEFDMGKPETSNSVGFYVGMGFNKQSTGGWHVRDHGGYHLQDGIGDYGTNPPTLALYRDETGSSGISEILIGEAVVNLDTNAHHFKIIDDGTGNIQVFFDGVLVIDVNDSANYNTVVQNNTGYLGAMSYGGQHGWIDNVVVIDNN